MTAKKKPEVSAEVAPEVSAEYRVSAPVIARRKVFAPGERITKDDVNDLNSWDNLLKKGFIVPA